MWPIVTDVSLSVGTCVGHTGEPHNNGWGVDLSGPKNVIKSGPGYPTFSGAIKSIGTVCCLIHSKIINDLYFI